MQLKRCFTCKIEKALSEFWPTKDGKGFSSCRPCANAYRNKWYRSERGRAHQARQAKLPAKRYSMARYKAKIRGIEFSLSKDEFSQLILLPCAYCGAVVSDNGVALDRIDSRRGYIPVNVVPCCNVCNQVKNDVFSYDEMKKLGAVIREIRAVRPIGKFKRSGRPRRMSASS